MSAATCPRCGLPVTSPATWAHDATGLMACEVADVVSHETATARR